MNNFLCNSMRFFVADGNRVLVDARITNRLDFSGSRLCCADNQSDIFTTNHVGKYYNSVL